MTIEPLQIVEILDRSEQGVTRPFLCRCEDGQLYYTKGTGAGRRSLWCEWLGGHLARDFGLPVPPFVLVQAPHGMIELFPEGGDLGGSPAFGSRLVGHTQELSVTHLDDVSSELRRDVLVFDWWVRNSDRSLTTRSGNPNLLWDADANRLVVIDHNVAFDREFNSREFIASHAFASQIDYVFQDLVERARYASRLRSALAVWASACENAPEEWLFADEERTVPADFDQDAELARLKRCTQEDFWKLAP